MIRHFQLALDGAYLLTNPMEGLQCFPLLGVDGVGVVENREELAKTRG